MDARSLLEKLANAESESVVTLPVAIPSSNDLPIFEFYQKLSHIFSEKKFKRINVVKFDAITISDAEESKKALLKLLQFNVAHLHFEFSDHWQIANIYYDVLKEFIHRLDNINALFPLLTCCLDAEKTDKYNTEFFNLTIERLSDSAQKIDVLLALSNIAQELEFKNCFEEALAFYNIAIQQFPKNKFACYSRGQLYAKEAANFGLALADFNRVLACIETLPDVNDDKYKEYTLFARGHLFLKISEVEMKDKLNYLQCAKQDFEALLTMNVVQESRIHYEKELAAVENKIKSHQIPVASHASLLFSASDSEEDVCIPDEEFVIKPIQ